MGLVLSCAPLGSISGAYCPTSLLQSRHLTLEMVCDKRFSRISVNHAISFAAIRRIGADHHLDILSCEIYCESLQQVQNVWDSLSRRFQSEEEPLRIVALWDGFGQEERRCSKIVISLDGCLSSILTPNSSLLMISCESKQLLLLF